jgi:hypothetical protein
MAFRQPQAPQQQRQVPFAGPSQPEPLSVQLPQRKRTLDESQEWVLFSPSNAPSTTRTHTTSTERTTRTAGLSRISDFGSLETAAHSGKVDREDDDDITCQGTEIDENEELDSLDDGLYAFHEQADGGGSSPKLYQSGGSILPTHDGFGGFRTSITPIQEQLWQYERYNPRRRHARRRSSVQKRLDAIEDQQELDNKDEKIQRIEKWRMDQSRALLEEIEAETRRKRRMSRASVARSSTEAGGEDHAAAAATTMEEVLTRPDSTHGQLSESDTESFWQRLTRRVINDLMGVDEDLLSVIFGEALPADVATSSSPISTKTEGMQEREMAPLPTSSWEHRLFQRLARELGMLVQHISEHPGAFSTYRSIQESPSYAGLPNVHHADQTPNRIPSPIDQHSASLSAPFAPTLQQPLQSDLSFWGIDNAAIDSPSVNRNTPLPNIAEEPSTAADQEREYWERDVDVKMVFKYLRNRFSRQSTSKLPNDSPSPPRRDPALEASTMSNESRKRAALIRRHHPLTSASRTATTDRLRRQSWHNNHAVNHGGLAGVAGLRRPGSSSCASQSTRSKRSLSRRSGGSSRNYWDLGGSVGSAGIGSEGGIA